MLIPFYYHSQPEKLDGYKDRIRIIPKLAVEYAMSQHKRIPDLEPTILKDAKSTERYIKFVIKGPWPEGEHMLLTNASATSWYMKYYKPKWPEGEQVLLTDPYHAVTYVLEFIRKRYPKAEPIILTNPYYSYIYARDVIKGPWPEAEDIIKTSPQWSYHYALYVINGRWKEGEPYIKQNKNWWNVYKNDLNVDDNHA